MGSEEIVIKNRVESLIQQLMIISKLNKGDKLNILGKDKIEIDEYWFFQNAFRRFWRCKKEDTINYIDAIYRNVFDALTLISKSIDLHIPTTPGKKFLTAGESEKYLNAKYLVDKLCNWIDKSINGLINLSATYEEKIPNFQSLIEDSKQCVEHTRKYCETFEGAYRKQTILSPLSIFCEEKKEEIPNINLSTSGVNLSNATNSNSNPSTPASDDTKRSSPDSKSFASVVGSDE